MKTNETDPVNSPVPCPECGATLPGGVLQGLCPRCVGRRAEAILADRASGPNAGARQEGEPSEAPGYCVDRYKLLQRLGEGGMGTVWMAEQNEPVRRKVALKIIKLGMDTRDVIARFEAERQALAVMDHPNIARLIDAGVTGTPGLSVGRPYFVMELVPGVRITDYCDQNHLTLHERLALFSRVCSAVQHAHQKGIIHRDLKPSNILVTLHDGVPVPKVIDFGIAKATGLRLTEKTLFTQLGAMLGTPAYMSPEQAELSGLDIDTRSDIYSLGVLLYELLTGRPPFDTKELVVAGMEQMLRTIREKEPLTPSARLTVLAKEDLMTLARRHGTEPPRLLSLVRGDLDWIVMKCLEKDRRRRYETANSLEADLDRYRNDEPVTARPPSTTYRVGKFVRKHRAAVAAATVIVLLLVSATVVSLSLAAWAERERGRAAAAQRSEADQKRAAIADRNRAESAEAAASENARRALDSAAEAKAVLQFFQDKVLAATRPEGLEGGIGREATIRAALDAAEPIIAQTFTNHSLAEASIRNVLGSTYSHLGDYVQAARQHQRAWSLRNGVLGPDHSLTVQSSSQLARAYEEGGRVFEALPLYEAALATMRRAGGRPETLVAMNNLAHGLLSAGRPSEAIVLLEPALEQMKRELGPDDPDVAGAMSNLASAYRDVDRSAEAVPLLEQVVEMMRKRHGLDHPHTLVATADLGGAYEGVKRYSNAVALLEGSLEPMKAKLGPLHLTTLRAMNNLAVAYEHVERTNDALALSESSCQLLAIKYRPEHPTAIKSVGNLARLYLRAGRWVEALRMFEQAMNSSESALGPVHTETLAAMTELAKASIAAQELEKAERLLRDAAARSRQTTNVDSLTRTDLPKVMNNLGVRWMRSGKFDRAATVLETALAEMRTAPGLRQPEILSCLKNLAESLFRSRQFAAAETHWREWIVSQPDGMEPAALAEARSRLGQCLLRQGRWNDAEPLLRESAAILEKQSRSRTLYLETRGALGSLLLAQEKYGDAEKALLEAYAGLTKISATEQRTSPTRTRLIQETVEQLGQLYEAWGKPDQARPWRNKINELEKPPEP